VFENRVLRRIFVPKREEVAGGWRRLHKELHSLHASPHNIMMTKLRMIRWVRHVWARFLLENLKGKDHSEDLGEDGRIILEWILGK
jgi:hypothetical protein